MDSVEKRFPFTTTEDSILEKNWACGSRDQIESQEFVITRTNNRYIGEYKTVKYSPAWWKIIDEPIVNALDQFVQQCGTNNPVTLLKVDFSPTGRVKIYNNGPGIDVVVHTVASEKLGREIWLPTLVFGIPFQGSNRVRPDDCITGGENGLGSKLCAILSTDSIAETVDRPGGKYFLQQWLDHKSIEKPPTIVDLSKPHKISRERTVPHTALSFQPDYAGLFGYTEFTEETYKHLADIVRTRVFYAAAYARYTLESLGLSRGIDVMFNDEKIPVRSMSDIAELFFPGSKQINCDIKPVITPGPKSQHYKYPWNVCAVMTSGNYSIRAISQVNGILVSEGKHISRITSVLTTAVEEKISKILNDKNVKFSPNHVTGNTFLFINTKIPNPAWTGQRKDIMSTDLRMFSGYSLDTRFTTNFTDSIKDRIIESIFAKTRNVIKSKSTATDYKKYAPAGDAGKKHRAQTNLIAVEGDSAMKQVLLGLTNSVGTERYGVICTGGVPMNVRRECFVNNSDVTKYVKMSKALAKNVFMMALINILGLDITYKYDPVSPSYKKEISDLNYGKLIMCVDQDVDGRGNIMGSILSTFELLWPNLIKQGFIQWMSTPVIRVYPRTGTNVHSFHSKLAFDRWVVTADMSKYEKPTYYKGLGTHSVEETIHMFKTLQSCLYTFYLDSNSSRLFDIYYGPDPQLRKTELSKPPAQITEEQILLRETTRMISCSEQLWFDADEYQRDNLDRKLDHAIDGQNQAGRKILDGLLKFGTKDKFKVEKVSGFISEKGNYHHGATSLQESIQGKAFIAVGGKQLPFLVPRSILGDRRCGGKEAAAPRYTDVSLNELLTTLLFPKADYNMLQFNFDEGKRGEPKYFVPIIPLVICESTEIPSHGWKLKLWARDVFKVIENVRKLINISDEIYLSDMPPWIGDKTPYKWNGDFRLVRGEPYSFGKYHYLETTNQIIITELPLRVWTDKYLEMLDKKLEKPNDYFSEVDPAGCNDKIVHIVITLRPGAMDRLENHGDLCYADGVEEYFQLRDHMDSHINLMTETNAVVEYCEYKTAMYQWFIVRKQYYEMRVERMRVMMELRLVKMENQIRYAEMSDELKMAGRSDARMVTLLTEHKFDRMARGLLKNPEFTPTADIRPEVLLGQNASFDYLIDMTDRSKSSESIAKAKVKLEKSRCELSEFNMMAARGRFPGSEIFESELNQLETVITNGMKTEWQFEKYGKYKFI